VSSLRLFPTQLVGINIWFTKNIYIQ
jgi:hypothetical protein